MYCTADDLRAAFGNEEIDQIGGDDPALKLQSACERASAEIDSYLQRAYNLPLPYTPQCIWQKALDIARYRLHSNQVREGGEGGKSIMRLNYEDAIKWLELVAQGKASIYPANNAVTNGGGDIGTAPFKAIGARTITVVSSPVIFNQDTLDKMQGG